MRGAIISAGGGLDPVAYPGSQTQTLSGFHYSRLFRYAAAADPAVSLAREPVPDLIDTYEIDGEGLTCILRLRRNVRFPPPLDRALSAADVTASWDYFNNPQSYRKGFIDSVDSLSSPDDSTLLLKLKRPDAWLLNKLSDPTALWILSREAATGAIDANQQVIGTGPWLYAGESPVAFRWRRNPAYYDAPRPYADGAELAIIADVATQEQQFAAGKLDEIRVSSTSDAAAVLKSQPQARHDEYPANLLPFLFSSSLQDPDSAFADPRMRQAASVAIDRQKLIDSVFAGSAAWENLVPQGMGKWWLDPRGSEAGAGAAWFLPDAKQARQLLAAAGHAASSFKFIYTDTGYGDLFKTFAEAVSRMLLEAGFTLSMMPMDFQSYVNGPLNQRMPQDAIVCALQTPFSGPDSYLTNMVGGKSSANPEQVQDAELAALCARQQMELDTDRRLQLVHEVQRLHAERMYYPPLVAANTHVIIQDWVQNFNVVSDYNFATESWPGVSLDAH